MMHDGISHQMVRENLSDKVRSEQRREWKRKLSKQKPVKKISSTMNIQIPEEFAILKVQQRPAWPDQSESGWK